MTDTVVDLSAAPTVQDYVLDHGDWSLIIGPVGSGKSLGSCARVMKLAMEQEPAADNIRYTRFAIVRNTRPQLQTTTMDTWQELFPEDVCGPIRQTVPMMHRITIPPSQEEPGLDCEVYFMPLDKPRDVRNVLSLNLTGAFINEAREVPFSIIKELKKRVGRYPSKERGTPTWYGMMLDTNPPDEDHWIHDYEMDLPAGFKIYHQPPAVLEVEPDSHGWVCVESDPRYKGMKFPRDYEVRGSTPPASGIAFAAGRHWAVNPDAENLINLVSDYYTKQVIVGDTLDGIRVYAQGRYGYVQEGKPVTPEYDDSTMSVVDLPLLKDRPLEIGLDVGSGTLQPSAVIGQRHPLGTHLIHREVVAFDLELEGFCNALLETIEELRTTFNVPDLKVSVAWCDPAGKARDELFATSAIEYLRSRGIPAREAPTNDPTYRIQALRGPMSRFINKKPGLLIDKRCKYLRKGLSGAWKYRRLQVSGERYADVPDKNEWSHVCDAAGYKMCGSGEFAAIKGREQMAASQAVVVPDIVWSPLD